MDELEQRVARGIAAELGMQDGGAPFELPDDLKLAWLDQGEVDFAAIARAIIPMVLEEAAKVADGYHERALEWAKTVRGLTEHLDETDSSRIAAAIRAIGAP